MRLVQKSLLHSGYFVLDDGEIYPAFTDDVINEGMQQTFSEHIRKIYGVIDLKKVLYDIKKFKELYGTIPQNLVEELRTGFSTCGELKQSHNLFIYK